jgi:hypothetical protein
VEHGLAMKGWNPIIYSNINEPVGQNVKWNKPGTEDKCCMMALICGK